MAAETRRKDCGKGYFCRKNVKKRYKLLFETIVTQTDFLEHYVKTRNLLITYTPRIENVIVDKLLYMKMVKGETDPTYKRLKQRFDTLYPTKKKHKNNKI